jgi:predicted transcriptional regulator
MMDIQSLKLDLISKIMTIDKPAVLNEINEILQKETKTDWWDNLPFEVQESILEGLTDIQNGNVLTHDQVMEEARQKYGL